MNEFKLIICLEQFYQDLLNKDDYSIYVTTDTNNGYLGDKKLWITNNELINKIGTI